MNCVYVYNTLKHLKPNINKVRLKSYKLLIQVPVKKKTTMTF